MLRKSTTKASRSNDQPFWLIILKMGSNALWWGDFWGSPTLGVEMSIKRNNLDKNRVNWIFWSKL